MDLETLANLGEFLGGVGVILSLIYLAVQVRGNTNSQRADITARVLDRVAALQHELGMNAEASALYNRGLVNPSALTVDERVRFTWMCTEFFGAMEFLLLQHQEGNVDQETFERWVKTLRWWLNFPGIVAFWKGRGAPYSETFTRHIESELARPTEHFNKQAWDAFLLTGSPAPRENGAVAK